MHNYIIIIFCYILETDANAMEEKSKLLRKAVEIKIIMESLRYSQEPDLKSFNTSRPGTVDFFLALL